MEEENINSVKTLKHEEKEDITMPKGKRRRPRRRLVRFKTKHGWVEFYVED